MLLNTFNDISFQKGSFGTVLRVARSSSSKQRADGKRRLFTLHLIEGHLKIGSASTTFISDSLLCLSLTQPLSLSHTTSLSLSLSLSVLSVGPFVLLTSLPCPPLSINLSLSLFSLSPHLCYSIFFLSFTIRAPVESVSFILPTLNYIVT